MKQWHIFPRWHTVPRLASVSVMIATFALLSACSMSPGMHMGKPQDVAKALEGEGAPPGALMTISPQLIEEQRSQRDTTVNQQIRQFFGAPEEYRVGPGDILNIVVWNHPELSLPMAGSNVSTNALNIADVGNGYNVSPDGRIQFPFVG